MKVNKVGNIKEYITTCVKCASEIQFTDYEEQQNKLCIIDDEWHIVCPICKNKIITRGIVDGCQFDYRRKV